MSKARYIQPRLEVIEGTISISERGQLEKLSLEMPRANGSIVGIRVKPLVLQEENENGELIAGNELITSKLYWGSIAGIPSESVALADWIATTLTPSWVNINLSYEDNAIKHYVWKGNLEAGKKLVFAFPARLGILQFESSCFSNQFNRTTGVTLTDPDTGYAEDYLFYISYNEGNDKEIEVRLY